MTVVIGTAGHIDHGKTTLLRALTGIDADRLPEERRRGMTIDVGYAHAVYDDGTVIDFVDVPGHDRLVGNMLVGAGEIDAAMVVVAADDGPRAQTIEHLELLDALDIRDGVAVITKADAVGGERAAGVAVTVESLLAATTLRGIPVRVVSSSTGAGIGELRVALGELATRLALGAAGSPRLAIDRAFGVRGRGVVVTGTLRGASIRPGATLRLEPGGRDARVREVQVHGSAVDRAEPGRVALNLAGVELRDIERGMTLVSGAPDRDGVQVTDRLLVELRAAARIATREPRLPADRSRLMLHVGTAAVPATLGRRGRAGVLLDDGSVAAILRLERPVAVAAGDRFVLRRPSPPRTEAGGRVLDPSPPAAAARRRVSPERIRALASATAGKERAAAIVDLHGAVGEGGSVTLASDILVASIARAVASVEAAPVGLAELRRNLTAGLRRQTALAERDAAIAADSVIEAAAANGAIVRDGDRVRNPRDTGSGPSASVAAAMDRLEAALSVTAPPPLGDAARAAGCPPAGVRALEAAERIVRVDDDLAWSAAAYRNLEATALTLAAREPLTPAAFRDATGTSRKYVMALLDDLGRRAVLRRTPDGHVPGPRAPATTG
ncbi:MAG TPA: selenocysteine-specific translation elongation factor [Candidatus Limnocylindrales bacterium]|nr:selenocysteine-specific translation elongation factor [Candidatus Limnocylindrales bacterium]